MSGSVLQLPALSQFSRGFYLQTPSDDIIFAFFCSANCICLPAPGTESLR